MLQSGGLAPRRGLALRLINLVAMNRPVPRIATKVSCQFGELTILTHCDQLGLQEHKLRFVDYLVRRESLGTRTKYCGQHNKTHKCQHKATDQDARDRTIGVCGYAAGAANALRPSTTNASTGVIAPTPERTT